MVISIVRKENLSVIKGVAAETFMIFRLRRLSDKINVSRVCQTTRDDLELYIFRVKGFHPIEKRFAHESARDVVVLKQTINLKIREIIFADFK